MDKKEKYSIRKIKGIVGSVLLMSIFVPMNIASASDYHYVDKESLSNSEKAQIKEGTPDSKIGSYVLVYEKNILPNTKAINKYVLTIFGLLSVGSLLFVVNNKKKTVSLLLVTTLGLTNLSSTMAVDLSKTIRESGTEGVVNILGYRYIGYIELDKAKEKEIEKATDNKKDNSLIQTEKNEKTISEKEKSLAIPEKTVEAVSEKGEPLVQPENPIAVVSEKGEPLVQPENPIGAVSEKGEPLVQPEKPTAVVSEKGESLVQPENPIGVVSEKGESLVQPENPIGVVSEKGEPLVQPENPIGIVSEKGESLIQPENPVGVISEKGESLVQPENPEAVVEKENPELSLVDTVEKPTEKEIKLNYNLINKDNVEIKKIKVEILDGTEVVKEVNLNTDKLTDSISGLKLYKDYKIRTSLTYNKGEEDKTITLEEKPFKLELKKVEIKDVKSTQLIKVNENKEEVDDTNFTTIPTDKTNYYLKITTNDNKTNKLAVKSITEETVNGENFYKITAEATDLIQHSKEEQIKNEYTYYIAKPKQKENNVYYDFGAIVQ